MYYLVYTVEGYVPKTTESVQSALESENRIDLWLGLWNQCHSILNSLKNNFKIFAVNKNIFITVLLVSRMKPKATNFPCYFLKVYKVTFTDFSTSKAPFTPSVCIISVSIGTQNGLQVFTIVLFRQSDRVMHENESQNHSQASTLASTLTLTLSLNTS